MKLLSITILVFSFFLFTSCGSFNPFSKNPGPVSKEIGPEGGTITTPDRRLTLSIPAGALENIETITIEELNPNNLQEEYREMKAVYEFGPDGLAFDQPVSILFEGSFKSHSDDEGVNIPFVTMGISSGDSASPHAINNLVIRPGGQSDEISVEGKISHFSRLYIERGSAKLTVLAPDEIEVGSVERVRMRISESNQDISSYIFYEPYDEYTSIEAFFWDNTHRYNQRLLPAEPPATNIPFNEDLVLSVPYTCISPGEEKLLIQVFVEFEHPGLQFTGETYTLRFELTDYPPEDRPYMDDKTVDAPMVRCVQEKDEEETPIVTDSDQRQDQTTDESNFPDYNPEKAKELLEEAGWIDRDRDGFREKDDIFSDNDFFSIESLEALPTGTPGERIIITRGYINNDFSDELNSSIGFGDGTFRHIRINRTEDGQIRLEPLPYSLGAFFDYETINIDDNITQVRSNIRHTYSQEGTYGIINVITKSGETNSEGDPSKDFFEELLNRSSVLTQATTETTVSFDDEEEEGILSEMDQISATLSGTPESGTLEGRVFTENGRGIEGVEVQVKFENGNFNTQKTDASGNYRFENVLRGNPVVSIPLNACEKNPREVEVKAFETVRADFVCDLDEQDDEEPSTDLVATESSTSLQSRSTFQSSRPVSYHWSAGASIGFSSRRAFDDPVGDQPDLVDSNVDLSSLNVALYSEYHLSKIEAIRNLVGNSVEISGGLYYRYSNVHFNQTFENGSGDRTFTDGVVDIHELSMYTRISEFIAFTIWDMGFDPFVTAGGGLIWNNGKFTLDFSDKSRETHNRNHRTAYPHLQIGTDVGINNRLGVRLSAGSTFGVGADNNWSINAGFWYDFCRSEKIIH